MKAVRRFDPERGVRLVSFALHWIRAEMHEYILRNWRLVKVATTKAQRKLFFNLRSMKASSAALSVDAGQGDREGPGRQAGGSRRDGNAPRRARHGARPDAGRRGQLRVADRLPDRRRGRAGADPRARSRRRRTARRACRPRSRSSTTAAAASSRRAGCARTTRARRCRTWPTEYGVSAERIRQIESKAMKAMRSADGGRRPDRATGTSEKRRPRAGVFFRADAAGDGAAAPSEAAAAARAPPACPARPRGWWGSGRTPTP